MSTASKPPHPIIKGATLTLFVVLVLGFVAYRAGAFDRAVPLPEASNELHPVVITNTSVAANTSAMSNTTLLANTTTASMYNSVHVEAPVIYYGEPTPEQMQMMFSSKSMILTESTPWSLFAAPNFAEQEKQRKAMMSSSKSTTIIEPDQSYGPFGIFMNSTTPQPKEQPVFRQGKK